MTRFGTASAPHQSPAPGRAWPPATASPARNGDGGSPNPSRGDVPVDRSLTQVWCDGVLVRVTRHPDGTPDALECWDHGDQPPRLVASAHLGKRRPHEWTVE